MSITKEQPSRADFSARVAILRLARSVNELAAAVEQLTADQVSPHQPAVEERRRRVDESIGKVRVQLQKAISEVWEEPGSNDMFVNEEDGSEEQY